MRLLNNNKNTLSIINALNESLTETQNDSDKKSFYDYVVEDFNTYLDHNNISPDNITEEDLGDYFTGFVHEIENDEDIDELNRAEDFIRSKYNIIDNTDDYQEYDDGDTDWAAEEESDALDRFENRYMNGGNGATFNESVRYATNIDWETDGDNKAKKELPKKVEIPQDVTEDNVADWLSDKYGWLVNSVSITESANDRYQVRELDGPGAKFGVYDTKQKKSEERVIMKQGNVTCLKKDNKFKVFEDADTNLVEYDNQEEAMRDALNRCGVNPDNELHEEKDDLKESTQYQVIKTLNVGPSNYQSEVHGTYNSYEQAEDACNELNAQGIGATIKEVNEIDEALKKLLLKKEELYNDDTISDEDYYSQIEIIDNIIANNYSVKDIEEAEKELGINS